MLEGWRTAKLGDVATVYTRTVPTRSVELPYIGLEHFDGGSPRIERSARSGDLSGNGILVEPGDVLFSKLRPYLNKVAVAHESAICSTEVLVWRTNNSAYLTQNFLALLLRSKDAVAFANASSAGTRMPRTSARVMSNLPIVVPPPSEQRRIVDLIKVVDLSIEAAGNEITATSALLRDARIDLIRRVERRARFRDAFTRVRTPVEVKVSERYRELGIRSHGKGAFDKPELTGADLGAKKVFWLSPGDLAFNIVFAWEGAVALLGQDAAGKVASHRFPTYRGSRDWSAEYAAQYFRTAAGLQALKDYSPGGAGRNKTLSVSRLEDHIMPIPGDKEGRLIVTTLRVLADAVESVQAEAEALRTLRSNLLGVLLSGGHEIPSSYDQFLNLDEEAAA